MFIFIPSKDATGFTFISQSIKKIKEHLKNNNFIYINDPSAGEHVIINVYMDISSDKYDDINYQLKIFEKGRVLMGIIFEPYEIK